MYKRQVEGCAYATVIAQAVSALLCFLYIVRKFDILKLSRADFRISFGIMAVSYTHLDVYKRQGGSVR